MSSLQTLRSRLAKLSQQQQQQQQQVQQQSDAEGTATMEGCTTGSALVKEDTGSVLHGFNTVDLTRERGWLQELETKASSAEEWLAFLQHIRDSVTFTSDNNKLMTLLHYYSKALKCVSEESTKHEAYGQLQVKYAQLKGQLTKEDGQRAFSAARTNARRFAFVHVAAAQFELDNGSSQKARQILLKAKDRCAEPSEMITMAMRNLISGHTCLLSEKEQAGISQATAGKENQTAGTSELLQPRKSWLAESQNRATLGSVNSNITPPNPDTRNSRKAASSGVSTGLSVYTDVVKPPAQGKTTATSGDEGDGNGKASKMDSVKSVSATPDQESDSKPFVYVTQRGARRAGRVPLNNLPQPRESRHSECEGESTAPLNGGAASHEDPVQGSQSSARTLRSCHSTPDCKKPSVLSYSLFNKPKRFTGKPLRVLKTSGLPELQDGTEGGDEDSFQMAPLPESTTPPGVDERDEVDGFAAQQDENVAAREEEHMATGGHSVTGHQPRRTDSNSDSGVIMHSPDNTNRQNEVRAQGQGQGMQASGSGQAASQQVTHPPVVATATTERPNQLPAVPQLPVMPSVQLSAALSGLQQQQMSVGAVPCGMPTPGNLPGMQPQTQQQMAAAFMCTPMAKQPEILTINGKTYVALRMIGRGGSSKVYEVLSCSDTRLCAVKCVNLDCADDATVQSYRNEIELLSKLQYSDRIIKMYDFEYSESQAMLYVVMERGDTDLMSYFRRSKKQGDMHSLKIKFYWMEMLQAVQVLQKEGIVHSDLKPANFLLVEGRLKLIDFGIANAIQQDMTSVTRDQQIGTLNYMSPEAIMDVGGEGQLDEMGRPKPRFKIGVKSDVWSLGCMLYNMVYNCTPFQKVSNALKLQAIINPAYKIEFPHTDDPHLLDTLQKCLQRDPKQRPSIEQLLSHPYLQKM